MFPIRGNDAERANRVRKIKHQDTRPAPGGSDGGPVDYTRWYPPDTPFGWGERFPTPFTNVTAGLSGGQWLNQFLPNSDWTPDPLWLWPTVAHSDGSFQTQLMGGTPAKPMTNDTVQTMHSMSAAQNRVSGLDISGIAGSFGRSEVL